MNTSWISDNWLKFAAVIMLVLAPVLVLPVTYYQMLNWVVVGAAVLVAWQARRMNLMPVAWLFALIAVVFNPIAPIYLSQSVWHILDFVTAGIFVSSLFIVKEKNQVV